MQTICDRHGTELRPHIKTHKMVELARRQLQAGAAGLVCSKLSEAEAMLPSGVSSIFIANSIVDPLKAPRLRRLAESLNDLTLSVTSMGQAVALNQVLEGAGLTLPVMLAIDTGLRREGVRSLDDAVSLASEIRQLPRLRLRGLYTHEGHAYRCGTEEIDRIASEVCETLRHGGSRLGHRRTRPPRIPAVGGTWFCDRN